MSKGDELSRVLLVEGADDRHVIEHLREKLAPSLKFGYRGKQGIDSLLKSITTELKAPGRIALGILVDANTNPASRWQAIRNRVGDFAELPTSPSAGGTIVNGVPRFGVWLMPDNNSPGELEDFIVQLLPKDDPLWLHAARFIDCIPTEHRKFRQKDVRAKLHAWLATQKKPRPMGTAISAGSLDTKVALATDLIKWLKELFGPS